LAGLNVRLIGEAFTTLVTFCQQLLVFPQVSVATHVAVMISGNARCNDSYQCYGDIGPAARVEGQGRVEAPGAAALDGLVAGTSQERGVVSTTITSCVHTVLLLQ